MSVKVILLEDEPDVGEMLSEYLGHNGFEVSWFTDGKACLAGLDESYSACILDIMVPEKSGIEVLQELRNDPKFARLPVIMLTAKDSEQDHVAGLGYGADAYLAKPTPFPIVLAYLKRMTAQGKQEEGITLGQVRLDTEYRAAYLQDQNLNLTLTEFELLTTLLKAKGRVHSRQQLLQLIDPEEDRGLNIRTVDAHIKNLRAKLAEYGDHIKTVRGVGYVIEKDSDAHY